jgi:hypothetical protein
MEDLKAQDARRRTASPSALVAAPHLAAAGTASHPSLPLLDLLARISLAISLREVSEEQPGGRGDDTVGNTERPSSASRPEVSAKVVDIGQRRVDRLGKTRYGPSRPGSVRTRTDATSGDMDLGVRLAVVSKSKMSVGDGP